MSQRKDTAIGRINWTLEAGDPDTLRDRYDLWAQDYDSDITTGEDYHAPRKSVEALAGLVPRDRDVLDAGCGTGLVGLAMQAAGYGAIDGLDFSPGMLTEAERKGLYRRLLQADLNQTLPLSAASYDAVIMVGTTLHVTGSCFYEFARILRPGGLLLFCGWDRLFDQSEFSVAAAFLVEQGQLSEESISAPFKPLPRSEPHMDYRIYVYRRLAI